MWQLFPLRALPRVWPLRPRLLFQNPTGQIPLRHKNFLSFVSFVPSWDLVFDLWHSSPAATCSKRLSRFSRRADLRYFLSAHRMRGCGVGVNSSRLGTTR